MLSGRYSFFFVVRNCDAVTSLMMIIVVVIMTDRGKKVGSEPSRNDRKLTENVVQVENN